MKDPICSECLEPCALTSPVYGREMHESCERILDEALDAMPDCSGDDGESLGSYDPFM